MSARTPPGERQAATTMPAAIEEDLIPRRNAVNSPIDDPRPHESADYAKEKGDLRPVLRTGRQSAACRGALEQQREDGRQEGCPSDGADDVNVPFHVAHLTTSLDATPPCPRRLRSTTRRTQGPQNPCPTGRNPACLARGTAPQVCSRLIAPIPVYVNRRPQIIGFSIERDVIAFHHRHTARLRQTT